MAKQLTAKDLGVDDPEVLVDGNTTKKTPKEDSSEMKMMGFPKDGDVLGADVIEKQDAEVKAKQKKAEDDLAEEALKRLNGEDEEAEEEPEVLDGETKAAYEKRVKDAQKKMHEATTKSAKLEKMVVDFEKKLKEASENAPVQTPSGENPFDGQRQKVADETISKAAAIPVPVPPQDKDDPEFDAKWKDYQKQMSEYNAKVARVWVDAQTQIAKITREEEKQADADKKEALTAIHEAITEAGSPLINDDGDIEDGVMEMFWAQYNVVSKKLSVEDQIKKTVEQCKAIYEKVRGKEKERMTKEKKNQENLEVLGRGSKITTKKEPGLPQSFSDIQKAVFNKRRFRHSP